MLLAQRMGLTVLRRTISPDYSIFGEIFFADCDTEFYDSEKEQMVQEHVQAKTIVVDPQAYFLRNLGSYNLTIVHECVHCGIEKRLNWNSCTIGMLPRLNARWLAVSATPVRSVQRTGWNSRQMSFHRKS